MDPFNPLDWTATPFLLLYCVCAVGVMWLLLESRFWFGSPVTKPREDGLGLLHLAYLAGGVGRAAGAALVGLVEAGAAVPDRDQRMVWFNPTVRVPIELQPFRYVSGGGARLEAFRIQFSHQWARLHDDLARRGLVPTDAEITRFRCQGALLLGLLMALGVCKVAVGLSRHRPVGWLVALMILFGFFGAIVLCARPYRNRAGTAALEAARRVHARAARAPLPDEMALAYALSGPAVLAGSGYRWMLSSGETSFGGGGGDGGGGCGGGSGCGGCGGGN